MHIKLQIKEIALKLKNDNAIHALIKEIEEFYNENPRYVSIQESEKNIDIDSMQCWESIEEEYNNICESYEIDSNLIDVTQAQKIWILQKCENKSDDALTDYLIIEDRMKYLARKIGLDAITKYYHIFNNA